jgi:predicted dehydrogenase
MSEARNPYRWGILGTSGIAGQFAAQLARCSNASLYAVASRSTERAQAIMSAWGAKVGYGSYEELIADRKVDIVYVATPASLHHRHCLLALNAGKPVLCEKPFALNSADARAVVSAAADAGVFCMEAMWMRFSPLVQQMREEIRSGRLGSIKFFMANIGYRSAAGSLEDAEPGRGALLNFGVYGVSLAHFLFGPPKTVQADMKTNRSGLDTSFSASLEYPDLMATVHGSVDATMTNDVVVTGTNGRLRLGAPFINPASLQSVRVAELPTAPSTLRRARRLAEKLPFGALLQDSFLIALLRGYGGLVVRPRGANGLHLEAEEVMKCLRDGKTESAIMPLNETVSVMETLDQVRTACMH